MKNQQIIVAIITSIIWMITISAITMDASIIGEAWSNTEVVSAEITKYAYRAILAVDQSGNVHIAWKDQTNYSNAGSDWDVFYKKRTLDGNWTETEVVSIESTGDCNCLHMAVDQSGNVHIAWKDQTNYSNAGSDWDVFYKKRTLDGNWTETEVVSTEGNENCGCPSLAIDKNTNVYIVWSDFTKYSDSGDDMDVFYRKKTLDGNWTETEVVSIESTGDSWRPSVAVDSAGTIHVIWEEMTDFDNSSSDWDVFYKKRTLYENWTETEVVSTESTGDSLSPSFLTVDSRGSLHLAWVDKTDYRDCDYDGDIFYKRKTLDGNWTETEVVSTESTGDTNWPSIAVDHNGTVYIVWKDKTTYGVSGYDGDIFYKKKTLDGNWTEIELVSVESKNDSNWPSIAVDARGMVHVSWWDEIASEKWPAEKWVVLYNYKYVEDEQPLFYDEEPDDEDSTDDDRIDSTPGFKFLLIIFSFVIIYLIKSRRHP